MVDNDVDSRADALLSQADIGKRVLYHPGNSDKCSKRGTLRYYGIPEFAEGYWCGIELDGPTGKHNGYLYGIHYFQCEDNHGVFVQANKVELDLNPPKRSHKRTGSGGGRIILNSPIGQKEFFKTSPPPIKKVGTPTLQKTLPSQAFNAKLRQLTGKGQKPPIQPLKAFGSEVGNVVIRKKASTPKPVKSYGHLRRSSSGENLNTKGLMNGRLVKSASSECVRKASSKEPSPKPFRRSTHENFTAVPQRKTSKGRVQRWPLTSTPVKGDITSTSTSSSTSVISTESNDTDANTISDQQVSSSNLAFVQTPETPPCDTTSNNTSNSSTIVSSGVDDSIVGLQTPVSQLKMQTQNSDFIDSNRGPPSPDLHHTQDRYQNTSGSATLSHPLSSVTMPHVTITKPTDVAATPITIAATPTDAAATPNDTATLPTHSGNLNGITPLNSNAEQKSSGVIINDKLLLDDTVSIIIAVGSCHGYC